MNFRRPLLTGVALLIAACGPRYARIPVHEGGGLTVKLRAERGDGGFVERGFRHPATISAVRVAHVLSRIDARIDEGDGATVRAAVPPEMLYDLGAAVSKAFARADANQEIVVQAIRTERRLGIFSDKYLTSFVAFMRGDELRIHFARSDWPIPKGLDDEVPEPWVNARATRFKLLPGEAMVSAGRQAVAVAWRDPVFRKPAASRLRAGGKAGRRTILLEGDAPESGAEPSTSSSGIEGGVSAETLRELADLEEARRAGAIGEAEYQRRRRELLSRDDARPTRGP